MFFKDLTQKIIDIRRPGKTVIVAIDGHGGSGKTYFSTTLVNELRRSGVSVDIISVDGFPLRKTEKDYISLRDYPEIKTVYRIDTDRLRRDVLNPLSKNIGGVYFSEDWWDKEEKELMKFSCRSVVIVEGCYSLSLELREYYGMTIFIDTFFEKTRQRAITRDLANGANPKIAPLLWDEIYYPQERRYIINSKPKQFADFVVTSFDDNKMVILDTA